MQGELSDWSSLAELVFADRYSTNKHSCTGALLIPQSAYKASRVHNHPLRSTFLDNDESAKWSMGDIPIVVLVCRVRDTGDTPALVQWKQEAISLRL